MIQIYQPQKVVKARSRSRSVHSNLSLQGLLLFACSHIGHKTYMRYSDIYVLHNISVFNQCKKIQQHDKIPFMQVVNFEFAFSCIFSILKRWPHMHERQQTSDRAQLIPWFQCLIRPLSKRRARNLNIANMLLQANYFISDYGRKDFPNLFAYSNTYFKDINP